MVSNPSPFSAALKILGMLPYSLLLMDLIFFSPPQIQSSVWLSQNQWKQASAFQNGIPKLTKSEETVLYKNGLTLLSVCLKICWVYKMI